MDCSRYTALECMWLDQTRDHCWTVSVSLVSFFLYWCYLVYTHIHTRQDRMLTSPTVFPGIKCLSVSGSSLGRWVSVPIFLSMWPGIPPFHDHYTTLNAGILTLAVDLYIWKVTPFRLTCTIVIPSKTHLEAVLCFQDSSTRIAFSNTQHMNENTQTSSK